MHTAALVVTGATGAALDRARAVLDDAAPAALPFVPRRRHRWARREGGIEVAVWVGTSESSWSADADGVVAVLGAARAVARHTSGIGAPGGVGTTGTCRDDRVRGSHVALAVGVDGSGAVTADEAGTVDLYWARRGPVVAVATHPELAARAVSPGGAPSRDPLMGAALAWHRYPVGSRTGFTGVRRLAPGEWVRLRGTHRPEVVMSPPPWAVAAAPSDDPPRIAAAIEEVRRSVAEELDAFLRSPRCSGVMDLTGGRDSRVLLSVALDAGLAHRFRYRTLGGPGLADVALASQIATTFGLDHEVHLPAPAEPQPWIDRARTFVRRTAGGANLWELCRPDPDGRELRVSGFFGEVLRGYYRVTRAPQTEAAVLALLERKIPRHPLLRPDVVEQLRREMADEVHESIGGATEPATGLLAYAVRNTLRFRFGPLHDCEPGERVAPFATAPVLAAVASVTHAARSAEILHYGLVAGSSPVLAAMATTGHDWDRDALAPLVRGLGLPPVPGPAPPAAAVGAATGTGGRGKAETLVARFHRTAADEQVAAITALFDDAANPVWDIADRAAATAAAARLPELPVLERQQVHGLAAAALWLEG